jgi:hypothetical protein
MRTRTPVNLADLAQAFAELRPEDAATRHWIAAVLGFTATPSEPSEELAPAPEMRRPPRPIIGPAQPVGPSPFDSQTEIVKPEPKKEEARTHTTLSFDLSGPIVGTPAGSAGERPEWWNKITVFSPHRDPARIPPPDPLLLPCWSRTTYMRTLSTTVPEGRLDIARLVDLIARLEVPAEIPRLPWQTMRNGLQVLVDYGDAMMPFREDQRRVLREVQDLTGSSAFFEVFLYRGTPGRWCRPLITPRGATAYELPPAGTPILALTDLGIGALGAGQPYVPIEEWLAFAGTAEIAGCPLTAFVPYAPDRWPPLLRGELAIVHWHHARSAPGARAAAFGDGAGNVQRLLDDLRQRNPQAVVLAHLASLAGRVELSLLRELRLTLLPAADGGAEADLWFSPLASVRSETALLLLPEVADALRRGLYRADPALFKEAWNIVQAFRERTGAFEGTRLEEEINYWLAQGGALAEARVQELLRRAVKTVYERGTQD